MAHDHSTTPKTAVRLLLAAAKALDTAAERQSSDAADDDHAEDSGGDSNSATEDDDEDEEDEEDADEERGEEEGGNSSDDEEEYTPDPTRDPVHDVSGVWGYTKRSQEDEYDGDVGSSSEEKEEDAEEEEASAVDAAAAVDPAVQPLADEEEARFLDREEVDGDCDMSNVSSSVHNSDLSDCEVPVKKRRKIEKANTTEVDCAAEDAAAATAKKAEEAAAAEAAAEKVRRLAAAAAEVAAEIPAQAASGSPQPLEVHNVPDSVLMLPMKEYTAWREANGVPRANEILAARRRTVLNRKYQLKSRQKRQLQLAAAEAKNRELEAQLKQSRAFGVAAAVVDSAAANTAAATAAAAAAGSSDDDMVNMESQDGVIMVSDSEDNGDSDSDVEIIDPSTFAASAAAQPNRPLFGQQSAA